MCGTSGLALAESVPKEFLPMLSGACLCGRVRYETVGTPFNLTFCHCNSCRRASGAPVVAWFSVPRASLRFVSGQPGYFRSSAGVTRRFCADCGSALTYENDQLPDQIDVTICTLDQPASLPPQDHTWASHRLPWVQMNDGLPQYPRLRP
jgi:hypothetical protein